MIKNKRRYLIYLGISLASLAIMILCGNIHGFWFDELAQISFSAPPKSLLDSLLVDDYTPPLFNVLANLWLKAVPYGERWFLLLPQLGVAVSCFVMALWADKWYGLRGGILGASLIGFSQLVIQQCGSEFRGYGIYLLCAALIFYARQRKTNPIVYAALLGALAYCHLFGVGICLALGMFDFVMILCKRKKPKCMIPYLFAAAIFIPWGIYILTTLDVSSSVSTLDWMIKPSIGDVIKLVAFLCGNHAVVCALFAIGLAAAIWAVLKNRKSLQDDILERAVPILVSAILILLVFCYAILQGDAPSMWVKRYFIGLYPCATITAVGGADLLLSRCRKYKECLLAAILLTTIPIWTVNALIGRTPFGVYYQREAAQVLLQESEIFEADTLIVSTQGIHVDGWTWMYLNRGDENGALHAYSPTEITVEELKNCKTLYVENGFDSYVDFAPDALSYIEDNFETVDEWTELSLTKYQTRNSYE